MANQIFSGRESELLQLDKAFIQLTDTRGTLMDNPGRVILIEGESGVGKSSLMRKFSSLHPQDNTFLQAFTECNSNDRVLAYKPLNAALFRLNELHSHLNRKKESLKSVLSFMQEVSPKWISLIPVFGSITAVTMETAMSLKQHIKDNKKPVINENEIFEAFNAELREKAAERPVILYFDDVQWMDMASAGLLLMLIRSMIADRYRILFVLSSTTGVTGMGMAAEQAVDISLARRIEQYAFDHHQAGVADWFEKISLAPFTVKEIDTFLLTRFPRHAFPGTFPAKLHEVTHGQARFICEIIEMQERRQIIRQTAGVYTLATEDLESLPASVGSAISARIGILDRKQQRLLAYASVSGHNFEAQMVGRVLNLDELELLDYIDDLSRNQHLLSAGPTRRINDSVVDMYKFIDQFTHRHIYENMDAARRRALHRRIAEVISETYGDLMQTDHELFFHRNRHRWIGAGIMDGITGKVISPEISGNGSGLSQLYMDAASDELNMSGYNQARFAWDEAIVHADLAFEFIGFASLESEGYHELLFEILGGRYLSFDWKGLYTESGSIARQMLDVAGETGLAEMKGQALIRLGRAVMGAGDPQTAQNHFLEALEVTRNCTDVFIKARIYNRLGMVSDAMRRFGEAIDYYKKAAEIHRTPGYEADLASNMLNTGISYRKKGEMKEALASFDEAAALFESGGVQSMLASVWNQQGLLYLQQQDFVQAENCFQKALKVDEATGNGKGKASRLLNLGRLESDRGNERAAIEYYRSSLAFYNLTEDFPSQVNVFTSMAQSWLALNEPAKAEQEISRALGINHKIAQNPNIAHLLSTRGDVFLATGRRQEALEDYRKALETDLASGEQMAQIDDYYKLAQYFMITGDRQAMQENLDSGLRLALTLNSLRDIGRFTAFGEPSSGM